MSFINYYSVHIIQPVNLNQSPYITFMLTWKTETPIGLQNHIIFKRHTITFILLFSEQ